METPSAVENPDGGLSEKETTLYSPFILRGFAEAIFLNLKTE
jgi:hypothetical protein